MHCGLWWLVLQVFRKYQGVEKKGKIGLGVCNERGRDTLERESS